MVVPLTASLFALVLSSLSLLICFISYGGLKPCPPLVCVLLALPRTLFSGALLFALFSFLWFVGCRSLSLYPSPDLFSNPAMTFFPSSCALTPPFWTPPLSSTYAPFPSFFVSCGLLIGMSQANTIASLGSGRSGVEKYRKNAYVSPPPFSALVSPLSSLEPRSTQRFLKFAAPSAAHDAPTLSPRAVWSFACSFVCFARLGLTRRPLCAHVCDRCRSVSFSWRLSCHFPLPSSSACFVFFSVVCLLRFSSFAPLSPSRRRGHHPSRGDSKHRSFLAFILHPFSFAPPSRSSPCLCSSL